MRDLNVEIILNTSSHTSKTNIIPVVRRYLESIQVTDNFVITEFDITNQVLHSEVKAIIIEEIPRLDGIINFSDHKLNFYVYSLDQNGPMVQMEEDEDGASNIATQLLLPSRQLHNLWENLYFDSDIKQNLLRYAKTMMEFSDKGVDCNIITCNRVILLHGPPGTGKTSLCKALAHKLAIRLQDRYHSSVLIEINSHSLFSKWFSESGKLVTKLFSKITEVVENPELLVCVLIDEVESLVHARNQCLSGNEPSDSIRVVNAVLTQIDQIKIHPNVLIFTTSNITESIDVAFVDRADIKQFLGLPSLSAIYQVYYSCLVELKKVGIIRGNDMVQPVSAIKNGCEDKYTKKLIDISEKSTGLSGRSLRKMPFITHALFLNSPDFSLDELLDALSRAVLREKEERKHFTTYITTC